MVPIVLGYVYKGRCLFDKKTWHNQLLMEYHLKQPSLSKFYQFPSFYLGHGIKLWVQIWTYIWMRHSASNT